MYIIKYCLCTNKMFCSFMFQVIPSILAVKANNGELKESIRFQMLAQDDLEKLLRKRKMKALMPQIVQALYLGGLLLFCAGSLVVSRNSFDPSSLLSFIMALTLLIEPIQVLLLLIYLMLLVYIG